MHFYHAATHLTSRHSLTARLLRQPLIPLPVIPVFSCSVLDFICSHAYIISSLNASLLYHYSRHTFTTSPPKYRHTSSFRFMIITTITLHPHSSSLHFIVPLHPTLPHSLAPTITPFPTRPSHDSDPAHNPMPPLHSELHPNPHTLSCCSHTILNTLTLCLHTRSLPTLPAWSPPQPRCNELSFPKLHIKAYPFSCTFNSHRSLRNTTVRSARWRWRTFELSDTTLRRRPHLSEGSTRLVAGIWICFLDPGYLGVYVWPCLLHLKHYC